MAHVGITDGPLTIDACLAAVRDARAGGVGFFVGTVRNHDHDRPVLSLRYEAHPSAEAVLAAICAEVAMTDVIAIAAEHRTGRLGIGDVAVVVAVSAVHRGEALRAAERLIDTVKAKLPIWKCQSFADGTEEWVNCG